MKEKEYIVLFLRKSKIKKILVISIMIATLVGCSFKRSDLSSNLDSSIKEAITNKPAKLTTNHKDLFSYYVPSNVGIKAKKENATIFVLDNYEVIMNLNIAGIITKRFYEASVIDFESLDNIIYKNNGTYTDYKGVTGSYSVYLFDINHKDSYYVMIQTEYVSYFSILPISLIPDFTQTFLYMGRTIEVQPDQIVELYSNKIQSDYNIEYSDLFKEETPVSGLLEDFIKESEKK